MPSALGEYAKGTFIPDAFGGGFTRGFEEEGAVAGWTLRIVSLLAIFQTIDDVGRAMRWWR